MHGGIFTYGLLIALAIALLFAAFTDLRHRIIYNWLNAAIALAAPFFWLSSGYGLMDAVYQLGFAIAVFAIFCGLYAIGGIGGGDVKLLSALSLWFGWLWFINLLIIMAFAGFFLTIAAWFWHEKIRKNPEKVRVPYGIAIAIAGIWAIIGQYMPLFKNVFHTASQLG